MVCGVDKFNGQNHAEIATIPYIQKCRNSTVPGCFLFPERDGIGRLVAFLGCPSLSVVLYNDRKFIVTE